MIDLGTTNINLIKLGTTEIIKAYLGETFVWACLSSCTVSGTESVGSTLTCSVTPSAVQSLCSFQWYRGDTAISGATSSTYTLVDADRTYQLKCVASIGSVSVTSNTTGKIYGWKSWSTYVESGSSYSKYPSQMAISYTISSTIKVTSASMVAYLHNQAFETETGYCKGSLYFGSTKLAEGEKVISSDGTTAYVNSPCSWSGEVTNGTIYAYDNKDDSSGGHLERRITMTLSGQEWSNS